MRFSSTLAPWRMWHELCMVGEGGVGVVAAKYCLSALDSFAASLQPMSRKSKRGQLSNAMGKSWSALPALQSVGAHKPFVAIRLIFTPFGQCNITNYAKDVRIQLLACQRICRGDSPKSVCLQVFLRYFDAGNSCQVVRCDSGHWLNHHLRPLCLLRTELWASSQGKSKALPTLQFLHLR